MGRGGRSSSGGRSSGGVGRSSSRSSGGRSHSSGRGGRSSSSSFGSRGGFSSFNGLNNHSRSFINISLPKSSGSYRSSPSYGHYHTSSNHGFGLKPSHFITIMLVLALMLSLIFPMLNTSGMTSSTKEREPLPAGSVIETEYVTDELGWIDSKTILHNGMQTFYKKTGVQPYLYILDNINGNINPTVDELGDYAHVLYDELFDDEGHLLLMFYEHGSDGNYKTYYVAGASAKTVIDNEAGDILLDYVDHYYYSDYSEDEMFSKVFESTANTIMRVDKNYTPLIFAVLLALMIIYHIVQAIIKRKKEEAEETERILNSDIDKL